MTRTVLKHNMEAIYLPKRSTIDISEKIGFDKYFNEYGLMVSSIIGSKDAKDVFPQLISGTEEEIKLLAGVCSIDNLRPQLSEESELPYDGFKADFVEHNVPEHALTLNTLRSIKNRNRNYNKKLNRNVLKYHGELNLEDECKAESQTVDLRACFFYVLTIRVYLPRLRPRCSLLRSSGPQVSQEFLCLSSETLDHLRDRILCSTDYQPLTGDVSENPFVSTENRTKFFLKIQDVNKSAMFYMGNDFYVDTRDPENVDYSAEVIKWGQSKGFDFGKVFKMENTTLYDMKDLRLGYPYVYIHQRFCEHLIVITDARLLHEMDFMDSTKYPIMLSFANLTGKYCNACRKKPFKYLVAGNRRLPHKIAHFCTICLTSFNYVNGMKIGNFEVHKYVDRASLI